MLVASLRSNRALSTEIPNAVATSRKPELSILPGMDSSKRQAMFSMAVAKSPRFSSRNFVTDS